MAIFNIAMLFYQRVITVGRCPASDKTHSLERSIIGENGWPTQGRRNSCAKRSKKTHPKWSKASSFLGACPIPHIFVWGSCFWFCIPRAPPAPPPPPPAPLCHKPSVTHNFVNHHLSHTTLSPTIFHTQSSTHTHTSLSATIFHTQSFTHNFVTHHLSHTSLSPTIFHTHLCHTPSFTHNFVTHHLSHTSLQPTILHTHLCHTPSFTHIFVTYHLSHTSLLFGMAGVALVALGGALGRRWSPGAQRHFAWQAWHLLHLVARLVAVGRPGHRATLRGRRGTWWHPPSFHVAGVALVDIHLRFAWQAWRLVTSTFVSRGRRGTWRHTPSFCVASVALVALGGAFGRRWSLGAPRHFAWQAWRLLHQVARLAAVGRPGRSATLRGIVLRGRRGAWRHTPAFGVASVALVALGGALGRCWSPGAPRHFAWHRFAWQAWRLVTSTFVSRGRRGTWWHPPSFRVASVALMALGWLWRGAWTHHLCHTIFHTQLCRTPSVTHHFVTHHLWHTIFHTHNFVNHHLSHTTLSPTIFHTHLCQPPSFTLIFVTHHLSHTSLSPTIFLSHTTLLLTIFHTPLCHTPSLSPAIFQTPSFTHTTLSHTIFHTPSQTFFHTPSFTHHFVTHHLSHITLSHTPSFNTPSFTHNFVTHHLSPHHLSHTTLSHTVFHTQLCHTLSFTHNFHTHHLLHTALSHTPSFTHHFVTHHLSHTTLSPTPFFFVTHHLSHTALSHTTLHIQLVLLLDLHHLLCPSFPVPATTCVAHYWKKLTCGVLRSFIVFVFFKPFGGTMLLTSQWSMYQI